MQPTLIRPTRSQRRETLPHCRRVALGALVVTLCLLQAASTLRAGSRYVDQNNATPSWPHDDWTNAAVHVQDAVNAAADNDTVWVRPGTYTVPSNAVHLAEPGYEIGTNVVFINKPLVLRSTDGAEKTIIDGQGAYRGVAFWNMKTTAGQRFALDGFTVTNGFASQMGGGVLFYHLYRYECWNGEVLNSVIVNNFVAYGTNAFPSIVNTARIGNGAFGGGICSYGSYFLAQLVVSNTVVRNNRADPQNTGAKGGGIFAEVGDRRHVYRSRIEQNESYIGGGVSLRQGGTNTLIESSVFARNTANALSASGGGGGGLSVEAGGYLVRNCLFHHNVSSNYGGAIATVQKDANTHIVNCTLVYNRAPNVLGGGIGVRYANNGTGSGINLYNSIVFSNTVQNIYYEITGGTHADAVSKSVFTNNITTVLQGSAPFPGTGNITAAPTFVDAGVDNYRLALGSRGVNEGFNLDPVLQGATDLDGNRRIDRTTGTVDIGCYEYPYPRGTSIVIR